MLLFQKRPKTFAPRLVHLRALWAQQIGCPVDQVTNTTHFLLAGGDSFGALHLETQIEAEFGVELPPHAMIEAPTPAAMAELIGERMDDRRAVPGLTPLSRLQAGAGTPVITFPGGTAEHAYFEAWMARLVDPERPFYALLNTGDDPDGPDETWVARVAERYEALVLAEQPEGPWLLFGVCLSAPIAWEVARRLSRRGETHLMLLDPAGGNKAASPRATPRLRGIGAYVPKTFSGHLSLLLTPNWENRGTAAAWAGRGSGEVRTELLPGHLTKHVYFAGGMLHVAPAVRAWLDAALAGRP